MAIIVSLFALLQQASNPSFYAVGRKPNKPVFRLLSDKHPDDVTTPGLLMVRIEGRMFFANAQRIQEKIFNLQEGMELKVLG
ncbi:MAG: hypothetical protein KZQ78_12785 [Candidatus Thiodiazotropha sp. (ex Ustalcina ferruginea)]|nr:hypothetical protein [Candidatus Thiodiazotropha sp. (ex Ustalcina ferruginea)]